MGLCTFACSLHSAVTGTPSAQKISSSESFSSDTAMNLSCLFQVLLVLVCVGNVVNAASNCDEALEESSACQERAMAAHDADYVEPSVELGKDWLDLEARRNCRLITSINTCIDELVAFCPDMLKPVTKSFLKVVDHWEELVVGYEEDGDWDTEKCPGAVALKAKKDLELTDCVAEVDKFTACSDEGKERRNKWLDTGADGRDHFAERKLCNWITEDYEQCYKPFVETKCGFEQKKADNLVANAVDIIQSHFPDWDSQKCPTASHVLSERQKNEEGKVDTEAEDKIKEADQRDEGESEEDHLAGNESSHTKKISLLGFVLMTVVPLIL